MAYRQFRRSTFSFGHAWCQFIVNLSLRDVDSSASARFRLWDAFYTGA
jgi:hypothetical protein